MHQKRNGEINDKLSISGQTFSIKSQIKNIFSLSGAMSQLLSSVVVAQNQPQTIHKRMDMTMSIKKNKKPLFTKTYGGPDLAQGLLTPDI